MPEPAAAPHGRDLPTQGPGVAPADRGSERDGAPPGWEAAPGLLTAQNLLLIVSLPAGQEVKSAKAKKFKVTKTGAFKNVRF